MEISANTPAVVTGGASGLGLATARAIAAKGAKVAIFDMKEDEGQKVAEELGGTFCKVNVTSEDDVAAAFAKAREAHGQERILVNCAGIRDYDSVLMASEEQWDKLLGVNLKGYVHACKHLLHEEPEGGVWTHCPRANDRPRWRSP